MKDRIEALRSEFTAAIAEANTTEALENLRVAYLGKKGSIAELMKGLRDVADKRKQVRLSTPSRARLKAKLQKEQRSFARLLSPQR